MPKFRTIVKEIEAVQWFEPGDHPAVQEKIVCDDLSYVLPGDLTLTLVRKGDWIFEPNEKGFHEVWSDYKFKLHYEEVND